jgi:hypothetical protein
LKKCLRRQLVGGLPYVTHRSEGGRQKSIRQDNSLAAYPTKRRVNPGLGFFSFKTARRTIGWYEVTNMIRKGQVEGIRKGDISGQVRFVESLFKVFA